MGQKSTAFDYYIHRNRNIRFNNMLHYTYRIDNLINGKYYIGKHSSESLDDDYMGSGPLIRTAIAKYGIENFKKTILKTFSTSEEAFEHEAQIVTMVEVKDPMCYNIQPGGKGGQKRFTDEELRERKLERLREYYQRPEVKEHRREYKKEYYQQNKESILEYQRECKKEYRQRPEFKERRRRYNQQNKEHLREYMKEYCQQNKKQHREYMKEYYRQNKEQQKEYHRKKREQKKKMKQTETI